ncbi:MAG: GHMP kinase [Planctomycetes bacterium]|nr:GHMP kinase [Planctomycetota bacterium]
MTWSIASGGEALRAQVLEFIARLERLPERPEVGAATLFDARRDLFCARAPGRLDVMGGIADYSGALVLELPLREAAWAAVQLQPEREVRVVSLGADGESRAADFTLGLDELEKRGRPIAYAAARRLFNKDPLRRWAAYVAGALLVLRREGLLHFEQGARILIDSAVPEAKGVSSSAAIEVAAMFALCAAHEIALAPRAAALLCQKVENLVAGAPCGVMDQMTAACGEEDRLLALLCQPAEPQGTIPVPREIAFFGLDSGIRHAVSGAEYAAVRTGAFMGYRILADHLGCAVREGRAGQPLRIEDERWRGFLANVDPTEFEVRLARLLPEEMDGEAFLERYGGISDPVTRVDPERIYAVRQPAAHPVFEHARVREFSELLRWPMRAATCVELGNLMFASHDSYSRCGIGCGGTDLLVELVKEAGPERGLFGAKTTGGGQGGTVAVLARRGAEQAVEEVAAEYERRTSRRPYVFRGSSPGAVAFGTLCLRGPCSG